MADGIMTIKEWQEAQPETEPKLAVGQRRIAFIDGVGGFDATVVSFTDTECVVKADDGHEWWIPFDARGMTGLGVTTDGEYIKSLEERGL